jgi:hypothetical protein
MVLFCSCTTFDNLKPVILQQAACSTSCHAQYASINCSSVEGRLLLISCYAWLLQVLPPDNLVRLTLPATSIQLRSLVALEAAHVRAGTNSNANFAGAQSLCVGTDGVDAHHNTYATVMKFAVTDPAGVTSAVLRLHVATLSTNLTSEMPLLLLGMASNDWAAQTPSSCRQHQHLEGGQHCK